MDACYSDGVFILLGMLVGFGPLVWALIDCYFIHPSGLWSIKMIMGPILLVYMLNATTLSFYLSHMFISYLPERSTVQAYVHNVFKFLLSVVISVISARLWNSYRASALCIRFSQCPEDTNIFIRWTNNVTDAICGTPDVNFKNDECRRWLAQLPLIGLCVLSIIMIYHISRLWWDKFETENPKIIPPELPSKTTAATSTEEPQTRRDDDKERTCKCKCCVGNTPKASGCRTNYVRLGDVIRNAFR